MPRGGNGTPVAETSGVAQAITEDQRQKTLLKTGALQTAILDSANFSSIATDERGVIQIFNVGAERMLGYAAEEVVNRITPGGHFRPPGTGGACPGAEHRAGHAHRARASRPWCSRRGAASRTSMS